MLKSLLSSQIRNRGMSLRNAGKEIGISHTTIIRSLKGEIMDMSTQKKISDWLHVLPSTLLDTESKTDDALAYQIAALLEREPKLAMVFGDAIQKVQQETIDPSIISEIAAFVAFKINLIKD
jgi:transcriptional regulator with XRE-family HTH domain